MIKRIWEVDLLRCRDGEDRGDQRPVSHKSHFPMFAFAGRTAVQGPLSGSTVSVSRYDDPPTGAESNDQASATDEQIFPDYDQPDPEPVYD
ncbi:MAG: hypothetical protein EPN23_10355 [Verrucomicrobia bacterium]|nr:MAG: hypothetical protein EPN23_10355 [Verrucomicrobiota bacterium]